MEELSTKNALHYEGLPTNVASTVFTEAPPLSLQSYVPSSRLNQRLWRLAIIVISVVSFTVIFTIAIQRSRRSEHSSSPVLPIDTPISSKNIVEMESNRHHSALKLYKNHEETALYAMIPHGIIDSNESVLYTEQVITGIGIRDLFWDPASILTQIVVDFRRMGGKLHVIAPNLKHRRGFQGTIPTSFSCSTIQSFDIIKDSSSGLLVKLSPWVTSPLISNDLSIVIANTYGGQYQYAIDDSLSLVNFNTSFASRTFTAIDVSLTYTSGGGSSYTAPPEAIANDVPVPSSMTVHVRRSFLLLDADEVLYRSRIYHPKSGLNSILYYDESANALQPRDKHLVIRHHLRDMLFKPPINPSGFDDCNVKRMDHGLKYLMFIVDAAAPQEISSAFVEGILWWDEAFQYAGYPKGTIRVVVSGLPTEGDFDPFDLGADNAHVQFVQWVDRDKRSYSLGTRVIDPRSGRIVKSFVRLESLRMRQDALIAQALLGPFQSDGNTNSSSIFGTLSAEVGSAILQRCRVLAAHEVGHALGLAHNFAGSTSGKVISESVMDYPPPIVAVDPLGRLVLNNRSYMNGVGFFDKVSIDFAYRQFHTSFEGSGGNSAEPKSHLVSPEEETALLFNLISNAEERGYIFLTDQDAAAGSADWRDTKWDSGSDPIIALNASLYTRAAALRALEKNTFAAVQPGYPLSQLQQILPILYLWHRYEVEAVAKLVGGSTFQYDVRDLQKNTSSDLKMSVVPISAEVQRKAIDQLIAALDPRVIRIPTGVLSSLLPTAFGYTTVLGGAEDLLPSRTRGADPVAAAEVAARVVLETLLLPERLERVAAQTFIGQNARRKQERRHSNRENRNFSVSFDKSTAYPGLMYLLGTLTNATLYQPLSALCNLPGLLHFSPRILYSPEDYLLELMAVQTVLMSSLLSVTTYSSSVSSSLVKSQVAAHVGSIRVVLRDALAACQVGTQGDSDLTDQADAHLSTDSDSQQELITAHMAFLLNMKEPFRLSSIPAGPPI